MAHLAVATDSSYFEPPLYTREELTFFMDHLCESPRVATFKGLPEHVSRAAVNEFLGRVYEFEEMRQAHGVEWCGSEPIKVCIKQYFAWLDTCASIRAKGGPKHPSLYAWDADGRGIRGATGSDAGTVRTMIQEDGTRVRLALKLDTPRGQVSLDPATAYIPDFVQRTAMPKALLNDRKKRQLECPICHFVANYTKGGNTAFNMARARMSQHLKKAKDDQNRHRTLWNAEYSSAKTTPVDVLSMTGSE
jgi:hypothetical protein